ncbi:MAG: signal recognition particle-docking protein FtsY [Desulfurococcales archaeon]|nr:signal recognition particle-docking protein FtsY [Desulfurococcales archaeon]
MVFDRLKSAISEVASSIRAGIGDRIAYKTLSVGDMEEYLEELLIGLVEADVAYDVAEDLVEEVKRRLTGAKVKRGEDVERIVKDAIRSRLREVLSIKAPDPLEEARRKCSMGEPYVIVFLGVNGVGKTTTIAKMAKMFKDAGLTPVVAAADTFRAGAQEQLEIHAKRLGIPIVKGGYGRDPASVAVDAINHARARGYCVVLVDTAGRMHVDRDLMNELRKIIRVSRPDMKILVVDSLTGNDAVEEARKFDEAVGIDAVILTKIDADVKGGSAISIAAATRKPVLYLGTGQDYGDLEKFDHEKFLNTILGPS